MKKMFEISLRLVLIFIIVSKFTTSDYISHVIDMDDILSENLMPASLILLENPENGIKRINQSLKMTPLDAMEGDGTFGKAMEMMNFHRLKMNQYLCRSFLAEQIVANMSVSRVKRRMGHVTPGIGETSESQIDVKNELINDEGSSAYKDWLSKSTTLEDIYRHYDHAENKIDNEEDGSKDDDFDEEFSAPVPEDKAQTPLRHRGQGGEEIYYAAGGDSGDFAGGHHHQSGGGHGGGGGGYLGGHSAAGGGYGDSHGGGAIYGGGHSGGGGGYISGHSGGGGGYSGGHSGYGGGFGVQEPIDGHVSFDEGHIRHPEHVVYSSPPKHHAYHEHNYYTKEKDLADLIEVALTALAFLAFKMFIIHVIMCIASVSSTATTTASMMPMSMGPTVTATGGMTSTGGGGGMTGTGAGTTSTGGGATDTGDGTDGMGGGSTSTGGDTTSTGDGTTSTGGGDTGDGGAEGATGGGDTAMGGGEMTATGGGGAGTSTGDDYGATEGEVPATGTAMETGGGDTGTGNTASGDTAPGDTAPGDTAPGDTAPGETGTGDTATGDTAPGDGGTSTGGTGGGRDSFKYRTRTRRDIPEIFNPDTQALNELARKVLVSIESALVAHTDDGECMRKSLCENNKWSRTLDGKGKIFVPVWSLGMSWLSGRLVNNVSASTSMLDSLKASLLGLGNANCEIIYQKCDLRRRVAERKRRRRRRKRFTQRDVE